ncbi:MAG: hypothetical protein GY913_18325 [Proteobacteria bacterium]|nr:hypothetical protein [Pseudomonadota bacterium]MCP4918866.1 hypothetical protein [Pseudomonadota bacterium]
MHGVESVVERLGVLLHEGEDGLAHSLARNFAMRIGAIADRALLPEVLRTFTRTVDDATLLAVLHILTVKGRGGNVAMRRAATELALNSKLFRDSLDYERIEDLYTAAWRADLKEVIPLFFSGRHRPGMTVAEAAPENEHLQQPLGRRKAMARQPDRDVLDRLLRDKHPAVIRILLNNGRIREQDVITMAALRPTKPEVLEIIAGHRKWATRYSVRKAVACNPYCPHPIATRLMHTLRQQDLSFIAGTSVLDEHIRDEARRLLRERKQSRQKPVVRGRPADELARQGEGPAPVPEIRGRPIDELAKDISPLRRPD